MATLTKRHVLCEGISLGGIFVALFLLQLLIVSCHPVCREWQCEHARTNCPRFDSARLYLPPESHSRGIELELLQGNSGTHLYANVFSLPLPYVSQEPKAIVHVTIDESSFSVACELLQGGQRLLFPDDAASMILTAICQGQIVTLSVGRYSEMVISTSFEKLYREKMLSEI